MNKCNLCKATLTKGPLQNRSAEAEGFGVHIEGIPTLVCSKGCEGFYWPHLDFGVEIFDILMEESENYAKKKGFFITKQLCVTCNTELADTETEHIFKFSKKQQAGNEIKLDITTTRSLSCNKCNRLFLRRQTSTHDKYHIAIANVISEALTKDLIWE